jgi:hypothetical protein
VRVVVVVCFYFSGCLTDCCFLFSLFSFYCRLYFWHAFFGVPGAQNDINVLDCSPLFTGLLEGSAPQVRYVVNDNIYKMGYYLADGIYPEWQILMKTISEPQSEKQKLFAKRQESRRKDVERGFGGIQVCLFFFIPYFFDCHLSNIRLRPPFSILSFIEQVSYYCPTM